MPLIAVGLCLAYLSLVFGLRSLLRLRQTGSAGWTSLARRGYQEGAADALFLVGLLVDLAGPALAAAGLLPLSHAIAGIQATVAGVVVFAAALALALLAQRTMGSAWRTGVDRAAHDPLATTGPFALVRHPVYTSMLGASVAVALLAPTILAVLGLAACLAGLELQARRVEEPYLLSHYGEAYARYASRVGRFVPGVGRLS